MLSLFEITALLLFFAALFGWINVRFIGLPQTVGLLLMALLVSLALILIDYFIPGSNVRQTVTAAVEQIDFFDTLMRGMLAFLLFAGAIHVDFALLKDVRWPVGVLATIGVLLSTVLVAMAIWAAAQAMEIALPFAWALVFGALISPTDPVAVLSLLKSVRIPERLEMKIAGESLFNDGVGVVVFAVLLSVAVKGGDIDFVDAGEVFLFEAVGGVVLGLVAAFVAVRAMRAIDDYPTEILVSLALVAGVYALALHLHTSGPLAVVVAGLMIGNRGAATAMSETTHRHLFEFWEVIDELLNAVLFLLIGLEILVIGIHPVFLGLARHCDPDRARGALRVDHPAARNSRAPARIFTRVGGGPDLGWRARWDFSGACALGALRAVPRAHHRRHLRRRHLLCDRAGADHPRPCPPLAVRVRDHGPPLRGF